MFSGSLALFDRALKTEASGMRGHLLRLGFAGFIEIALLYAAATSLSLGAPGLSFFANICWLNVVFISLAGISLFATAVTEEKEEGTLGLLQMANVGRAAIMLGKSTSRLVAALLLLGVQIPFVLLAITLGGVLIGQIFAAFACLAAFLVLTANLGLFWSVVCRRSAAAAFWTGASLVLYFALPYVVGFLGRIAGPYIPDAAWSAWLTDEAPIAVEAFGVPARLNAIFQTGFSDGMGSRQVAFCLIAAAVLFGLAWLGFERFADADRAAAPDRGIAGRTKAGTTFAFLARPLGDPVAWKEFRFLVGGLRGLALRVIVLAGAFAVLVAYGIYDRGDPTSPLFWRDMAGFAAIGCAIAAAADSLYLATRIMSEELKWNTLGNLLLLPRGAVGLLFAKVRGAVWALLPATLAGLVCLLVFASLSDGLTAAYAFSVPVNPITWAVIAAWSLYLTLVAFLSTVVRYGATALAALTFAVGAYALSPVLLVSAVVGGATESPEAAAVPIAVVAAVLTLGGAAACVKRFEALAER